MTIALSAEVEQKLKAAAERRGMDINQYLTKLVERDMPVIDQATIDLINRWEAADRTDDPEEFARRQREFDEFKASINRNRIESDGPNARTPFP